AGRAVRGRRVRAQAGARIAGAGDVALIEGVAGHGVGARADPALAGVGLRAGVAVVGAAPVGTGGDGAGSVAVAGGGLVTLVGRRARVRRARADTARAHVVRGA